MRRTVEGCISDAPNQTSGPGEDTTDIRFSLVVPRFTAPAADLVELAQTQMATASEVLAEVLVQVGVSILACMRYVGQ